MPLNQGANPTGLDSFSPLFPISSTSFCFYPVFYDLGIAIYFAKFNTSTSTHFNPLMIYHLILILQVESSFLITLQLLLN